MKAERWRNNPGRRRKVEIFWLCVVAVAFAIVFVGLLVWVPK